MLELDDMSKLRRIVYAVQGILAYDDDKSLSTKERKRLTEFVDAGTVMLDVMKDLKKR